jgi:hypothetical protein
VLAAPAGARAAPEKLEVEASDPRIDEARAMHREALAAYETYDYLSAIAAWTRAYERVEGHPLADEIRQGVVYNLAAARMAQHRIDGDGAQLVLAKRLLERYAQALDRGAQAEHAQVAGKIAEIDILLRASREAAPAPRPADGSVTPSADQPRSRKNAVATGLLAGGSVAIAGAVGLFAGMGVGLARGDAADRAASDPMRPAADLAGLRDDGREANVVAIACGISAGVLLVAGVAMVVVGARKRADRKQRISMGLAEGFTWHF